MARFLEDEDLGSDELEIVISKTDFNLLLMKIMEAHNKASGEKFKFTLRGRLHTD